MLESVSAAVTDFKRLLKYGITKQIIINLKASIQKESIRKEIDKAIFEYEQES